MDHWWKRWPLDQIVWQPGLSLVDFAVLGPVGSDHFPVRAVLCLGGTSVQRPATPRPRDGDEAETTIAAARAMDMPRD